MFLSGERSSQLGKVWYTVVLHIRREEFHSWVVLGKVELCYLSGERSSQLGKVV